ncbi:CBD9-like protein [Pyrenochaeta sp. DS3sAY3a]|nr:CBD9-like protein [Pyrenochaeta sp. DS3sAY3a]
MVLLPSLLTPSTSTSTSATTTTTKSLLTLLTLTLTTTLPLLHLLPLTTPTTAFPFPQDSDDPTSSASQFSSPSTDPLTGLTTQRFFGARTQFTFALAMPSTTSASSIATTPSSFIGTLSFPLVAGQGWGAMGLTGDMEGNFILAVWPDGGGDVVASFRQATDEDNPPEVTGTFAVRPLPGGTSVNSTFLSYTFLCENCLDASLGVSVQASGNAVMGWALSERSPRGDVRDPGAFLGFHERGFGPFTARLGDAGAVGFEGVAATAGAPVQASRGAVRAVAGAAGAGSGDEGEGEDGEGESSDGEDEDDD